MLLPRLYRSITVKEYEDCIAAISVLFRHPELAAEVREFVFERYIDKPQTGLPSLVATGCANVVRAFICSQSLATCASSLVKLEKFVWEAEHPPYHDSLWKSLRTWFV
jgi:hypothetical protein